MKRGRASGQVRAGIRTLGRERGHAVALIGVFVALGMFLFLFVELVRADQLAVKTGRELARIDARWNRLQVEVLVTEPGNRRGSSVLTFRIWAEAVLEESRLASLATTTPELADLVSGLESEIRALTPERVAAAASDPYGQSSMDRLIESLQAWLESFTAGQTRAFQILLFLYGAVLLGAVGISVAFARDLWSSQRQGAESRLLAQRYIRIREDERSRIAAELHDDAAQSVAAAALVASRLAEDIGNHPCLDRLRHAIDSSLSTIRNLSRDIGGTGLQGLSLDRALDQLLAEQAEGIESEASYDGLANALVSEEQKLHIYRIVQECITNTVRHARAARIRLRVVYSYPDMMLRYTDDGVGFHPSRIDTDRPHLGLRSIAERARMLGGELAVKSKPGAGTTITVVIPLDRAP
ncbi:MAG: ATP-binding protein [Spirochaetia bacterium]